MIRLEEMLRFGWTLKGLKEIRFNLLILESNKHLISLYNITTESNFRITRIKEMVANLRSP